VEPTGRRRELEAKTRERIEEKWWRRRESNIKSGVPSRKSSVFRSFSSVIAPAVTAGVRAQTATNCVTE
jgi:hypothetical protein